MGSMTLTPTRTATADPTLELTDREMAILKATRSHSLSTVSLAEHVGYGHNPGLVTPILDRLEGLGLIDGFFAAGRATTSSLANHRRYYRLTDRGRKVL